MGLVPMPNSCREANILCRESTESWAPTCARNLAMSTTRTRISEGRLASVDKKPTCVSSSSRIIAVFGMYKCAFYGRPTGYDSFMRRHPRLSCLHLYDALLKVENPDVVAIRLNSVCHKSSGNLGQVGSPSSITAVAALCRSTK